MELDDLNQAKLLSIGMVMGLVAMCQILWPFLFIFISIHIILLAVLSSVLPTFEATLMGPTQSNCLALKFCVAQTREKAYVRYIIKLKESEKSET